MYAVIETGGKQYKVEQDQIVFVEKLIAEEKDVVTFDVVAVNKEVSQSPSPPTTAMGSVSKIVPIIIAARKPSIMILVVDIPFFLGFFFILFCSCAISFAPI